MFGQCGNWFGYNAMNGWGGIGMMIFWVIIIIALIYFFSKNRTTISAPYSESNALSILQERYARGEISDEEYETKKKALSKSR
ncbi:SHOCT domain-containing protein [Vallitalea okinawensis]|uniref:SHOCT domain-containing protein n=1 Tax=Vallitalea okinawensis TaxID=2078660 RepID=UPI001A9A6C38|nr:SHOCT domain-containing protein [Vallitalea okinawensis]